MSEKKGSRDIVLESMPGPHRPEPGDVERHVGAGAGQVRMRFVAPVVFITQ